MSQALVRVERSCLSQWVPTKVYLSNHDTLWRARHNDKLVYVIQLNFGEVHCSTKCKRLEQSRFSATKREVPLQKLRFVITSLVNKTEWYLIHKYLFIQINIQLATCENHKIKCFKLLNINGEKNLHHQNWGCRSWWLIRYWILCDKEKFLPVSANCYYHHAY